MVKAPRADVQARFWQTGPATFVNLLRGGTQVSEESQKTEKLSLLQVFGSVISSFLGVQKNANRERDFKRGRARDFIIVGIVLTLLFILSVWGVVQLVMHFAIPS
jgi:amino acid permease